VWILDSPASRAEGEGLLTVRKAFAVMDCFDFEHPQRTAQQIGEELGMPKSTVHRFLKLLCEERFLAECPRPGYYKLGIRLFEFGLMVQESFEIKAVAGEILRELSDALRQTVHLVVREGGEGIYIDKVEPPGAQVKYSRVGKKLPLYCSAAGKVLLSDLPAGEIRELLGETFATYTPRTIVALKGLIEELKGVRERGWAMDDEELELGLACVGAAIRDHSGEIVAALTVSGLRPQFAAPRLREIVVRLKDAAARVSAEMGYRA